MPRTTPDFGLCDRCAHQHLVQTGRGSLFSRCEQWRVDPDWPKYPRMPVRECSRFSPRRDEGGAGGAEVRSG